MLPDLAPHAASPAVEWLQTAALVLALVVSVVALGAAVAAYPRRRRIRTLASESRRIAAGELGQAVEPGLPDDLGDVEVELERIRALLLEREREAGQLRARAAAADARVAEAERASDAKTRFIGNVSHEFRTPLSSIIGFTSLLAAEHSRLPDAQRAEYLEIVLRNARHLLHVINDILNLSKVEAGTLEVSPAPVYVPEAVAAVVASLGPMAEERRIAVRTVDRSRHFAVADTGRLRQVLQNLLENAIKYSPQGSAVEVEVASGPGGVRIDVRDQGPGISSADQPRLFKEFSRIPQPGVRVAGAGLGLALSKQLVELMGGTIGVDSGPGPGSDFWVLLPAGEEIASEGAAAPRPTGAGARERMGTVAVVDDDPDIRAFVAAILEGVGYAVVSDDGRDGAADRTFTWKAAAASRRWRNSAGASRWRACPSWRSRRRARRRTWRASTPPASTGTSSSPWSPTPSSAVSTARSPPRPRSALRAMLHGPRVHRCHPPRLPSVHPLRKRIGTLTSRTRCRSTRHPSTRSHLSKQERFRRTMPMRWTTRTTTWPRCGRGSARGWPAGSGGWKARSRRGMRTRSSARCTSCAARRRGTATTTCPAPRARPRRRCGPGRARRTGPSPVC
jgi:signal transduction histidine kinase